MCGVQLHHLRRLLIKLYEKQKLETWLYVQIGAVIFSKSSYTIVVFRHLMLFLFILKFLNMKKYCFICIFSFCRAVLQTNFTYFR